MFFNNALRRCPLWLEKQLTCAYFMVRGISSHGRMHSVKTTVQGHSMSVQILPALQDNYMYLIIDEKTKEAAIVDPVNPAVVTSAVEESNVKLTKILTTHHHWDHAGGNENMCKKYKNIEVLGGDERIEAVNKIVCNGDSFNIGELKVQCLATPCHTTGHICYLVTGGDNDSPAVFTGDTLFAGGCGRFFEGTPEQMYKALVEILGSLPNETKIYCGHEYTCKNLQFALIVEPSNENIKKRLEWATGQRKIQKPTIPSTIEDEKKTNPFMRVCEPPVMEHTATTDAIKTMASLRKEKDNF